MTNAKGVLEWMEWKEREKKLKENMTNEEYIRTCSTEELAKFLADETIDAFFRHASGELPRINGTEAWTRWLKEKHHE